MNNVCILGSMNMDLVYHIKDILRIGETILSSKQRKGAQPSIPYINEIY